MGLPMAGAPTDQAPVIAGAAKEPWAPVPQMGTGPEFVLAGSQTLSRTEWASMEAAMTSEERNTHRMLQTWMQDKAKQMGVKPEVVEEESESEDEAEGEEEDGDVSPASGKGSGKGFMKIFNKTIKIIQNASKSYRKNVLNNDFDA